MRNKFKKNKNTEGFMMVEVLVAASIIAVSVLFAMAVTQKSVQVSRQGMHTAQAAFLLEEGAEAVRVIRDNNWANISSLNSGATYYPAFADNTWTLSSMPETVGIFTRSVSVANVKRDSITKDISDIGTEDSGTKLVTISVSWQEGGTTISKNLQFYIMDIFS